MMRATSLYIVLSSLVAACGGSESPPVSEPAPAAETPANEKHATFPPELQAFHDVLSPRWHAAKGDERRTTTCGAIAEFQTRAAAVVSAPAPAGTDPAAWTASTAELDRSVTGLASACTATDPAGFEPAFEAVHNAFHGAMELAVGKHEHGEHDQHGGKHEHADPAGGEHGDSKSGH